MRILMLIHHIPYPTISGGHVREYSLIKRLAQQHEIFLICFTRNPYEEESIQHLQQFCSQISFFPAYSLPSQKTRIKLTFLSPKPWSLNVYTSPIVKAKIAELLRTESIDLIHVQCYYLTLNIPQKCSVPLILLEDNVEFIYSRRRRQVAKHWFEKSLHFLNALKEQYWEIHTWHRAHTCAFTSEPDQKIAEKYLPKGSVSVIPNGVDTTYYVNQQAEDTVPSLVYLGNFGYLPNVDAMLYFCQSIFPQIIEQVTETKLIILGASPPESIKALANHPAISVTGKLADTRSYLSRAWIFVCPLRIGGGTKIKMLEAMSMQKAIVSTSVGCEGLDLVSGEHFLLANEAEQFSESVIKLLRDADLRKTLGEQARKLVEQQYDWDRSAQLLETLYKQIKTQQ